MDAVKAWHVEHEYFRRLLTLLQKQLDVFHGGERPNYELVLDIVSYLREYSDRLLGPEDWAAVRDAMPSIEDPLFGDQPEERFRDLRRQIALET